MSRAIDQAFNDGRLAFRAGTQMEQCPRRGRLQRAAWLRGFEEERARATAEKATPEQREEARRVAGKLRDFLQTL